MQFKSSTILRDVEGTPVREPIPNADGTTAFRDLTHGILAARALSKQFPTDKELQPEEVATRFLLGTRLVGDDEVELTVDEAKLVKDRSAKFGMLGAPVVIAIDEAAKSTRNGKKAD